MEAPRGLVAERFAIDGMEFVAFTWKPEHELPRLTPAERGVLELLLRGATNAEIGEARQASARTIANQVASLLRKLRATSRYELISRFGGSHP